MVEITPTGGITMAKKRARFSAKKRIETKVTGFVDTAIDWGSNEKFEIESADALFLDILPFVAGKFNPGFAEGEWAYESTYWVHKNIGANPRDSYICPHMLTRNNPNVPTQRCPICEHLAEQRRNPDADEQELRDMGPKQRNLFVVRNPVEWGQGEFKVWDISYHLFYKMLEGVVRDLDEDEEDFANFADPTDGCTLKLGLDERSFAGHKFYEVARAGFKKRKSQYTDAIVDSTPCLDGMLKVLSYQELEAVLKSVPDEVAEDDTDDVVMEDEEEDDSMDAVVDNGTEEPTAEQPESEKPPVPASVASSSDDADDDEWDDWDDE